MNAIPLTRRTVLLGTAALATTALPRRSSAIAVSETIPLRKRKSIDKLSAPELAAYEHAIKVVKDRSAANPGDPTGYAYWASLHDVYDESIHSGCAHFSEKFLPWHRRYLFDFEALLQQSDPEITANVTIPYWDWTVPPEGGGHFPAAFTRSGSPLFDTRLTITPPPWDAGDIKTMVQEKDWSLFAGKPDPSDGFGTNPGIVESGPHNTLHTNISRHMRSPATAVQDPIFWSFHSGIDLVWSRWQAVHVSATKPQPFADPAAVIWFRDKSFTVGTTADTTAYGYEYDYDFSIDSAPIAIAQAESVRNPAKRVTSFSAAPAQGGGVTMSMAPPANAFNAETVLRLAQVKVLADRSYRLNLYLHPKDVDLSSLGDDARKGYFMRLITLWQAHHAGEAEIFVRPTPEQLAHLNEGWVVTVQSEAVPVDAEPAPAGGPHTQMNMPAQAPSALPATSGLLPKLEIQER